jgi:hypothetical protein
MRELGCIAQSCIACVSLSLFSTRCLCEVAISAAVLALLRAEGCEPAAAAHQWLLLPASDTGPRPLHCAHFPWKVGVMERRLDAGAGRRP